jgi:hypothetical protein
VAQLRLVKLLNPDRITKRLQKERNFRPHAEHHHAAWVFYRNAEKNEVGSALQLQASLVFSAFCMEAYLNHMGSKCLSYWDEIDRSPVLAKLRLLMAEFKVHFEAGERPLQTVRQLFGYRNWMAHSRSKLIKEETEYEGEVDDAVLMAAPRDKWEAFVTLENTKRCLEDVAKLINALNEKAPHPDLDLVIVTSHTYTEG